MRSDLEVRLVRVASILEGVTRLAIYPETPEEKKERLEDIKVALRSQGWKNSFIYGLYQDINKEKVWLTFSVDQVALGCSNKKKALLSFSDNDAQTIANQITKQAHKLVGLEPKAPEPTEAEKLAKLLVSYGWKEPQVEGDVVRAFRHLEGSPLESLISLAYETTSGRTNFAYLPQGSNPIQLLAWKIEDLNIGPEALIAKLSTLFESVVIRAKKLDEKEELAQEQAKQEKEEAEAYQKWKALQLKKQDKKDRETSWKEKLRKETLV